MIQWESERPFNRSCAPAGRVTRADAVDIPRQLQDVTERPRHQSRGPRMGRACPFAQYCNRECKYAASSSSACQAEFGGYAIDTIASERMKQQWREEW
jgi:hypothetical protein